MSNEIFRGKAVGKVWWAHGAYSYHPAEKRGFIVNVGIDNIGPIAHLIEVDPATKGQFTGLYDATTWEELTPDEQKFYKKKDWKGRMIFEGDILEAHYDDLFPENATRTVVVWMHGSDEFAQVGWGMKQDDREPDELCPHDAKMNRVIGNIHENSDLLKEVLA